jgi:hypothetical protein
MSTIQYKSHLNPIDIFSESYTKSSTYMQPWIFIDKTTIMGSSFQIRSVEEGLIRIQEAAFLFRKEV